jgi:hypothetical protein
VQDSEYQKKLLKKKFLLPCFFPIEDRKRFQQFFSSRVKPDARFLQPLIAQKLLPPYVSGSYVLTLVTFAKSKQFLGRLWEYLGGFKISVLGKYKILKGLQVIFCLQLYVLSPFK